MKPPARPSTPRTPESPERRSLLEWLGTATVLGLTSPLLLQACGAGGGRGSGATDAGDTTGADDAFDATPPDAQIPDTADGDAPDPREVHSPDASDDARDGVPPDVGGDPSRLQGGPCDDGSWPTPASKGSHPIFDGWAVRTVDEQALVDLLTDWRLRIDGMVATPRTYTFCDLLAIGLASQVTDFHCVEGWSVLDVPWDGLPLSALLDRAGPDPAATHVSIGCRRGIYTESLRLEVAREPRTLLALGVAGRTLPLPHGFPARVVVPRLLGYKNPKYVEVLTLTDTELVGFWPRYGYPVSGEVPPERLREGKY